MDVFLIENDDLLEKHNTIRDKRLLALFLVGIIVKDPHLRHVVSRICTSQNLSSGLAE